MSAATTPLMTVGDIARETDSPIHRIIYAIKSRQVKPVAKYGSAKVYDPAAVARIRTALREAEERRRPLNAN